MNFFTLRFQSFGAQICSGALAILWIITSVLPLARADESPFGYIYTSDSLPAAQWEYEQWITWRSGKARGAYRSLDLRNEIEYGITDRFSGALYINTSWLKHQGMYDAEDVGRDLDETNSFGVNGTSLEFKYRLLSPYLDPIGLAIYLEPEIEIRNAQTGESEIAKALEFRVILHKNFLDDTLTFASNIMIEPEWEKLPDGNAKELWAEFTLGGAYRFIPNWWLGLEFRNHREFPDFSSQEHSAYFLGPSVHYGGKHYWLTLTILPQIGGSPTLLGTGSDGAPIDGGSLHLGQHEKVEIRLKAGFNL